MDTVQTRRPSTPKFTPLTEDIAINIPLPPSPLQLTSASLSPSNPSSSRSNSTTTTPTTPTSPKKYPRRSSSLRLGKSPITTSYSQFDTPVHSKPIPPSIVISKTSLDNLQSKKQSLTPTPTISPNRRGPMSSENLRLSSLPPMPTRRSSNGLDNNNLTVKTDPETPTPTPTPKSTSAPTPPKSSRGLDKLSQWFKSKMKVFHDDEEENSHQHRGNSSPKNESEGDLRIVTTPPSPSSSSSATLQESNTPLSTSENDSSSQIKRRPSVFSTLSRASSISFNFRNPIKGRGRSQSNPHHFNQHQQQQNHHQHDSLTPHSTSPRSVYSAFHYNVYTTSPTNHQQVKAQSLGRSKSINLARGKTRRQMYFSKEALPFYTIIDDHRIDSLEHGGLYSMPPKIASKIREACCLRTGTRWNYDAKRRVIVIESIEEEKLDKAVAVFGEWLELIDDGEDAYEDEGTGSSNDTASSDSVFIQDYYCDE